jgi:transcriptional regulator with XRE-family HTH domain
MQMRQELGRRIQEAREEAGLTQAQLAELIGLKYAQSVSNYERGKSEPRRKRLRRIAEVTRKPISHFVDNETMIPEDAVARLGQSLDAMEARLAGRLDALDQRFGDLETRLDAQEQQDAPPAKKAGPTARRGKK